MKQQNFSDIEYGMRKKVTKREEFLKIMEEIIPWEEWVACIQPYYYKGERGRPPLGIERMLRMYLLQNWFTLSDEMVEDSIYDSYAMRSFVGIDFTQEQVPDATTLLKFRHILERNGIGKILFDAINRTLEEHGHIMHGGTIVDATLISAPSSTKNAEKKRDPEMSQTRKGNNWYFGMKAHVGVDAGSGYVHTVEVTTAKENDVTVAHKLLRSDDETAYGDSGYLGLEKRDEIRKDPRKSQIAFRINRRPSMIGKMPDGYGKDLEKKVEQQKSTIRRKVEYPFHVVKDIFGYKKTAYRGLMKNLNRLYILFGSANLLGCARSGGLRPIVA